MVSSNLDHIVFYYTVSEILRRKLHKSPVLPTRVSFESLTQTLSLGLDCRIWNSATKNKTPFPRATPDGANGMVFFITSMVSTLIFIDTAVQKPPNRRFYILKKAHKMSHANLWTVYTLCPEKSGLLSKVQWFTLIQYTEQRSLKITENTLTSIWTLCAKLQVSSVSGSWYYYLLSATIQKCNFPKGNYQC